MRPRLLTAAPGLASSLTAMAVALSMGVAHGQGSPPGTGAGTSPGGPGTSQGVPVDPGTGATPTQGVGNTNRAGGGIGAGARPGGAAAARAADDLPRPPAVIGLYQIDRYDAIQQLQKELAAKPKDLAGWIVLGEIAHEVAMDAPADRAGEYFALSLNAFEKAQALAPDNPGLKAAVQFTRDQQAGEKDFEQQRDLATVTYIEARRRDLEATGFTPAVRAYGSPGTGLAVRSRAPVPGAGGGAAGTGSGVGTGATATTGAVSAGAGLPGTGNRPAPLIDAARQAGTGAGTTVTDAPAPGASPTRTNSPEPIVGSGRSTYGVADGPVAGAGATRGPQYGPYYTPFMLPGGVPYTYQDYSRSYFPPGLGERAAAATTIQRGLPQATPNAFERSILQGRGQPGTGTTTLPGDTARPRASDTPPPDPAPAVRPPAPSPGTSDR